jgi:hypothetical protein
MPVGASCSSWWDAVSEIVVVFMPDS